MRRVASRSVLGDRYAHGEDEAPCLRRNRLIRKPIAKMKGHQE